MSLLNRYIITIFLFAIPLAGCSGEWSTYPQQTVTGQQISNIIGVGDTVKIDVFDQPALTGQYEVAADGTISLPLLRVVEIGGLTPELAADKIAMKLVEEGYLVNPKVTLSLSQVQTVMVLGEVMTGGEYAFRDGMTVLDLVAKSGGFTYRANQSDFDIVRKNQNGLDQVIDGYLSTRIKPGDLVRVRERYF